MELDEHVQSVRTRQDLAEFLERLSDDLRANPARWENDGLEQFLDALARWTKSMENYYRNTGQPVPQEPTWKTFAQMMLAARIYE